MRLSRRAAVWSSAGALIALCTVVAVTQFTRPRLWRPATHAFSPTCAAGCDSLGSVRLGHIGPVTMIAQPRVDDDIAQWAGCMDSVLRCMADALSRACVARSTCPAACKTRFAAASAAITDSTELLSALERVFVDSGAFCVPR